METTPFDPSKLRLGVAGQLSETHVAPAQAAGDDGYDPAYRAKATEAAVKFESFFIGHMLHQMRSGTRELAGDDSPYKDKVNEDMLDLADNMVADKMAGQRAFGIADAILRQLLPPTRGAGGVNTAISADRVAAPQAAASAVKQNSTE
ncbi:hypothetical protein ACLB1G_03120 [Oxalobacteraceae bacterium A2-2]